MGEPELIVFVDEDGQPTGEIGSKQESHTATTRLHLAFSCYIFRKPGNDFLMTQRAISKRVWPGVWTNSLCGHPMPGETIEDAIRRRAKFELGLDDLEDITCVLPKYRYTTPQFNGIIENEFCPVYVAYVADDPDLNTDEVEAYRWIAWKEYAKILTDKAAHVSYWTKDQYKQLKHREPFVSLLNAGK